MDDWKTNIQWKGTDLCMDYICPDCAFQGHIDGLFCYAIKCRECGSKYKLPTDISSLMVKIPDGDDELFLVSE